MKIDTRWVWIALALPIVLACGTLEVGIEQTPTPTSAPTVQVILPTLTPTLIVLASPSATASLPTATPSPQVTLPVPPSRERISFGAGSTVHTFSTTLARGVPKGYILTILAQQQLIVDADGDVTIVVVDAQNRTVIPVSTRQGHWVGAIPQKGDCTIILRGEGTFNITLNIPPLGG